MKPPISNPYAWTPHALGTLRDGAELLLEPMTADAAQRLGPAVASIDPWKRYGFDGATLARGFETTGDGAVRFQVQIDGVLAGIVIVRSPWLTGPYLQMLALLPGYSGRGIGAIILRWFEATARSGNARNIWLCVAGFNVDAHRLYVRHGFERVGMLPDLLQDGVDEMLMRKKL
jgi:ribosomal protein S18 acetylase RimI-like enzyme